MKLLLLQVLFASSGFRTIVSSFILFTNILKLKQSVLYAIHYLAIALRDKGAPNDFTGKAELIFEVTRT
jgi:hypothetical protein